MKFIREERRGVVEDTIKRGERRLQRENESEEESKYEKGKKTRRSGKSKWGGLGRGKQNKSVKRK